MSHRVERVGRATEPGFTGLELVVGAGPTKTLVLRDPQHEYVFTAK